MKLESDILKKTAVVKDEIVLSPEQIRKIQEIILDMAKDMLAFCRRHGLTLFLGGGTALGGIRHRGFIPWDEDIDLNMTRKDYEYFARHFPEEYGDRYYMLANYDTDDPAKAAFLVVFKYGTVYRKPLDAPGQTKGISADIWIIENTFDSPFLRKLHGYGYLVLSGMLSCKYYNRYWDSVSAYYAGNDELLRGMRIKKRLGYLLFFLSEKRMSGWQAAWGRLCRNDESKYVTIPQGRKKFFGEMFPRHPFTDPVPVEFEGEEFQICKNWDEYLTRLYGKDYMQIPPEEKREKHAVLELKY